MRTVIVTVPDNKEIYFRNLLKKNHFKSRIIQQNEEDEDLIAKWIDEGMKSEEVPEKEIFEIFRKHGIKV